MATEACNGREREAGHGHLTAPDMNKTLTAAMKSDRAARLAVMARVHGEWILAANPSTGPHPHCECSRCGLPSPRPFRALLAVAA